MDPREGSESRLCHKTVAPPNTATGSECGTKAVFNISDVCFQKYANFTGNPCSKNTGLKQSTGWKAYVGASCICGDGEGNGWSCTSVCEADQASGVGACAPRICKVNSTTKKAGCGCNEGYLFVGGKCTRQIDYCTTCQHNCHMGQQCISESLDVSNGKGYTCSACSAELGFKATSGGFSDSCENINECLAGTHNCDTTAECIDRDPSAKSTFGIKYECKCRTGFSGKGTTCDMCIDINECAIPGICGNNSICTNTLGSYTCICQKGYKPSGKGSGQHQDCVNVNECTEGGAECKVNSYCNDTEGSYECPCNPGFIGIGKTLCSPDISICDSCDNKTTVCQLNAQKTAYECVCRANHTRQSLTKCAPNTYCDNPTQIKCAPDQKANCTDKPDGSGYTCVCKEGYLDVGEGEAAGMGYKCVDQNPCKRMQPCALVANTDCVWRPYGDISKNWTCECKPNYVRQVAGQGNYSAPCYELGGPMTNNCTQCLTNSEACQPNINNPVLKECVCREGYKRPDGPDAQSGVCVNINECLNVNANDCDGVRGSCEDLVPTKENNYQRYQCKCLPGFTGNGKKNNCTNINECLGKVCAENQDCTDLTPGYRCDCKTGFTKDKTDLTKCIDIDECSLGMSKCNAYATCNNTLGSYTCFCDQMNGVKQSGSNSNGVICVPIDQCEEGKYGVPSQNACPDPNMDCFADKNTFRCACKWGYMLDGQKCNNINECRDEQKNDCDRSTTYCQDKTPGYECKCKTGFIKSPTSNTTCDDENECDRTGLDKVCKNTHTHCQNTFGSFACYCDDGFVQAPNTTTANVYCLPKNPCIGPINPCYGGICIYKPDVEPYYTCQCNDGFAIHNKTTCIDSKYCDESNKYACPANSKCLSKVCQCETGYSWVDAQQPITLESLKTRACKPVDWCQQFRQQECGDMMCRNKGPAQGECYCDAGFQKVGQKCEDINECLNGTYTCAKNSKCVNTPGSYKCECDEGFYKDKTQTTNPDRPVCIDLDECDFMLDNCTAYKNTVCRNTEGSFACDCSVGYKRDQIGGVDNGQIPYRSCVKQNPCDPNPCEPNAKCDNRSGCAVCVCPRGFMGDGTPKQICTDIDECNLGHDNCTVLERCVNTNGSFFCTCITGYKRENGQCVDINECKEDPMICGDKLKVCNNTQGSFICWCRPGYVDLGNGTCTDLNECSQPGICGDPADGNRCNNTIGSYGCYCDKGYEKPCKDQATCPDRCKNIDECKTQDPCGKNAPCTDTPGSFRCDCKKDYFGDAYDKTNGCIYKPLCERTPCTKPNTHCVSINEQTTICPCVDGYLDVNGVCQKNPCTTGFKCIGGTCVSRVEGSKLITNCSCPIEQVYQESTATCVPSNVCKCPAGQYSCQNSTVCSDPFVMSCTPDRGDAKCTCRPYLKYNNKTKKCDGQSICNLWSCPLASICVPIPDEFKNERSRLCECTGRGKIWRQGNREEDAGECVTDVKCEKEKYCSDRSNSICDTKKGICICDSDNMYVEDPTGKTRNCTHLDACLHFSEVYGHPKCIGKWTVPDGRTDVCECNCPPGFIKECVNGDQMTCTPNDACLGNPCKFNASHPYCIDTTNLVGYGSYYCTCNGTVASANFTIDPTDGKCKKPDPCKTRGPCPSNSDCNPQNGQCICKAGYWSSGQISPGKEIQCDDLDECSAPNVAKCMDNARCNNTVGSFTCDCFPGFRKETVPAYNISQPSLPLITYKTFDYTCIDIDECKLNATICGIKRLTNEVIPCVNTPGDYECRCLTGMTQVTTKTCQDVALATADTCTNCSANAHCVYIVGESTARNCSCNDGYEGNGVGADGCKPIQYCKDPVCDVNAICTNTNPGYTCKCKKGYYGSGAPMMCQLDDFCKVGVNPCPRLSTCHNLGQKGPQPTKSGIMAQRWTTCNCTEGYVFTRDTFTCEDRDECALKIRMGDDLHKPCPPNSTCENTQGSFTCHCPVGYKYNPLSNDCDDINECQTGLADKCKPQTGSCINTVGSWYCLCNSGFINFKNDTQLCEYNNRCLTAQNPCDPKTSICLDAFSSGFRCQCLPGYQQSLNDPLKCVDINECAYPNNCSSLTQNCENFDGGYKCTCRAQYEQKGSECVPLVPCTTKCPDYSICVLDRQNKSSCKCIDNYKWIADKKTCSIDACKDTDCGEGGKCIVIQNRNDSLQYSQLPYRCECEEGYTLDVAKRQCKQGTLSKCDAESLCGIGTCKPSAAAPGYQCSCPDSGCFPKCEENQCDKLATCKTATRDNKTVLAYCQCPEGYYGFGTNSTGCFPKQTCDERLCSKYAACQLVNGKSSCQCDSHYEGNGTYCVDIDECARGTHNCDKNADCMNVQGGFVCTCKPGFTGTGTKDACKDLNECDPTLRLDMKCNTTSTVCNNLEGSYNCSCKEGYRNTTYPFFLCPDINECVENKTICGVHQCKNLQPGYECICQSGYSLEPDRHTCKDIDECTTGAHNCSSDGSCINLPGSFKCQCKEGFTGDGVKCEVIDKCVDPKDNACKKETTTCLMVPNKPEYVCKCKDGYKNPAGQSVVHDCEDIDECVSGDIDYNPDSTVCKNLPGSYELSCKPGYINNSTTASTKKVDCQPFDECSDDPSFAATLAIAAKGGVLNKDWKTWMVKPKNNNSAYAYCFWEAWNETDPRRFSGVQLPGCKDLAPGQLMTTFNTKENFKTPMGYSCACADGTFDLDGSKPKCSDAVCNCDASKGFKCSSGQCVCNDPKKKIRVKKGSSYCDDIECDKDDVAPSKVSSKSSKIFCNNNTWSAVPGYRIIRDTITLEVIDVVDIDECKERPTNPCCERNCTGESCVQCQNTEGSFECIVKKGSQTYKCKTGAVDTTQCVCNQIDCKTQQAWYSSCINECNATLDSRLNNAKYNKPLCSRILQSNKFVTFQSLKDLYVHICAMTNDNNNKYACFFDKTGADLTTTPLFNYWGECAADAAKVTCEGGAKAVAKRVSGANYPYCPARHTPLPNEPAVAQPIGIPYPVQPQCMDYLADAFIKGDFYVMSMDSTELDQAY